MRRRLFSVASFSIILAMALAPACGGATDPHDLLGGGESTSSSGSGGLDAGHDTSTHVGSPDSGAPLDSSIGLDSSVGPIDTGSPLPEASPIPEAGPTGLLCPPTTCKTGDVCCATNTGEGNTPTFKCQDATKACGTTSAPGTPISCAVAADCPGEVCCGYNDNDGYYSKVSCEATCTGTDPTTGATEITFCDPNGDDCPAGTTCQASEVLAGYSVCN
ncbi:MAG: hypothetical protein ABSE49_06620 [Polyangiaceae bacterium]|jgi:hypothetical protein